MTDRYQPLRDAIAAGPTKGPWRADTDGKPDNDMHHGVIAECNDLWIAAMYRSGTTTDGDDKSPESEKEVAANARYVAAADPDTIAALLKERNALRDALTELYAAVKGECPSLLDEDRGGSARLDMAVSAALADGEEA